MRLSRDWRLVVALGCLGWTVLYAGRSVLSPVLGAIGQEWGLDPSRLGLLSSIFFVGYAGLQIPAGILADRVGKKGILVAGFALFAAATVLRGLAPSYGAALAAGLLAGLAQATYYATMFSISSSAVPAARRGLGSAIVYSGMALGSSGGYLLASLVAVGLGWTWRTPFLVLAGPAVVMAGLFALLLREPERAGIGAPGPAAGPAAAGATAGRHRTAPGPPFRAVVTPRLLQAYLLNFCSLYTFFMLLTWLPYYLEFERGVAGSVTGLVASVILWTSVPSGLAVSVLSDRTRSRVGPLRWLLPGAAVAVLGIAIGRGTVALYGALILYGLLGKSTTDPLLVAEVAEHAPAERSATALAVLNCAGMVASVLAPFVTGLLIEAFGDMRPAFYLAAAILLVGFAVSLRGAGGGK
jgi:MFS family permease